MLLAWQSYRQLKIRTSEIKLIEKMSKSTCFWTDYFYVTEIFLVHASWSIWAGTSNQEVITNVTYFFLTMGRQIVFTVICEIYTCLGIKLRSLALLWLFPRTLESWMLWAHPWHTRYVIHLFLVIEGQPSNHLT